MENLHQQGLRIVPFKPHPSHKLEWKKYKGEHQEELFVSFATKHGLHSCNVGHIREIVNYPEGKRTIRYQGYCCRLGISSATGHPNAFDDINDAKRWVENKYGIFCNQTETEFLVEPPKPKLYKPVIKASSAWLFNNNMLQYWDYKNNIWVCLSASEYITVKDDEILISEDTVKNHKLENCVIEVKN